MLHFYTTKNGNTAKINTEPILKKYILTFPKEKNLTTSF